MYLIYDFISPARCSFHYIYFSIMCTLYSSRWFSLFFLRFERSTNTELALLLAI